jgi:hypothetical protein
MITGYLLTPTRTEHPETLSLSTKLLRIIVPIWLVLMAAGTYLVWTYENTPDRSANPPTMWPASSRIPLDRRMPTMIIAIHPRCPCSRATIGELAQLMARTQGLVNAQVLFVRPVGFEQNWEKTDLWRSVAAIPGISLSVDPGGQEAQRFGSRTSGQVLVYDAEGRLMFTGGITGSRGHSGDNYGLTTILSLLTSGKAASSEGPVFGCPLFKDDSQKPTEEFCNEVHQN